MKKLFEEPRLELETFAISDSTMNLFLSGYELGDEDELDPAYNTTAIG